MSRHILEAALTLLAKNAAREVLAEEMAAALADPQVDEHAKSLAGYILRRLQLRHPAE